MFEASQRKSCVAMLRPDVDQKQKPHAIISCRGGGVVLLLRLLHSLTLMLTLTV